MNDFFLLLHAVGESTEREILAKLMQDASASHPPIPPEVPDNTNDANEADGAQQNMRLIPLSKAMKLTVLKKAWLGIKMCQ